MGQGLDDDDDDDDDCARRICQSDANFPLERLFSRGSVRGDH